MVGGARLIVTWMWADAGDNLGSLGQAAAKLNPWRKDTGTAAEIITSIEETLRENVRKHGSREVRLFFKLDGIDVLNHLQLSDTGLVFVDHTRAILVLKQLVTSGIEALQRVLEPGQSDAVDKLFDIVDHEIGIHLSETNIVAHRFYRNVVELNEIGRTKDEEISKLKEDLRVNGGIWSECMAKKSELEAKQSKLEATNDTLTRENLQIQRLIDLRAEAQKKIVVEKQKLVVEKQKLEEEKQKLEVEKQKLEEEKQKLEGENARIMKGFEKVSEQFSLESGKTVLELHNTIKGLEDDKVSFLAENKNLLERLVEKQQEMDAAELPHIANTQWKEVEDE
jgi:hypothetical protein